MIKPIIRNSCVSLCSGFDVAASVFGEGTPSAVVLLFEIDPSRGKSLVKIVAVERSLDGCQMFKGYERDRICYSGNEESTRELSCRERCAKSISVF